MLTNAFAFFFLVVLMFSTVFLLRSIAANRALILRVLRGDAPADAEADDERQIRVEPCRSLVLEPVTISICRI